MMPTDDETEKRNFAAKLASSAKIVEMQQIHAEPPEQPESPQAETDNQQINPEENPDSEPTALKKIGPHGGSMIEAHELAEAGAEQGAEAFAYLVEQQKKQSHQKVKITGKTKDKKRLKKPASSQKNYHDQMAIGRLVSFMFLLVIIAPLGLYFYFKLIALPYDANITQIPDVTTQRAEVAGIFHARHAEVGQLVARNRLILSIVPSGNALIDNRIAGKLTKVRLQISRLETQKAGQLTWVLPDDLRQRAYEDDDFTEFVLAQQKEFADYYDALDEYGREIYTQRQRLQSRITDAEESIQSLEQEKVNINKRVTRANQRDKQILRRELTYIDTDIFDTLALIEGFSRDLQSLQPRLQRLIKRRASSLGSELKKFEGQRGELLQKLGLADNALVQQFTSKTQSQVAEIMPRNVGDAFQKGDILYRLLPANNQLKTVTLSVRVPQEIMPFLTRNQSAFLLMKNNRGKMQKAKLNFIRVENNDFDAIGIYRLNIETLYERYKRLPLADEKISLVIKNLPLEVRLQGLWQRAQDKRRFAFDGTLDYRLPFFNEDNYIMLQNEAKDTDSFIAWVKTQWETISTKYRDEFLAIIK